MIPSIKKIIVLILTFCSLNSYSQEASEYGYALTAGIGFEAYGIYNLAAGNYNKELLENKFSPLIGVQYTNNFKNSEYSEIFCRALVSRNFLHLYTREFDGMNYETYKGTGNAYYFNTSIGYGINFKDHITLRVLYSPALLVAYNVANNMEAHEKFGVIKDGDVSPSFSRFDMSLGLQLERRITNKFKLSGEINYGLIKIFDVTGFPDHYRANIRLLCSYVFKEV